MQAANSQLTNQISDQLADQPADQLEAKSKMRLRIGDYEVHAIPTGKFGLDGGAMFGTVPKVLWQKTNPADEQNRILMEARALLLKSPQRNILIDTGVGGDFVEKYGEKLGAQFAHIYAVDREGDSLDKSLARHSLSADDIHEVILTHLHFDHAGGATRWHQGKLVPTFPKARYHIQKQNLFTAQTPNLREKASYLKANFEPLIEAGVVNLMEGACQNWLPYLSAEISHGHTLGQQTIRLSDGKNTLVYCADLIPTSTHVRLAWVMGYDLDPLTLIEEKRSLLAASSDNNFYLFFEHDPYCDLATIEPHREDFKVKERFRLG